MSVRRRLGRPLLGSLLALVLVAASCSSGDDSSGDGGNPDGGASGTPVVGGEITYGIEAGNSGGWCLPEAQLAASGIQMANAVYESLTAVNAEGEYVPFLLESIEPNADFTLWTLKVRPGIKFHDGTALDATVVKNNLDAFRGEYPARSPLLFTFVMQDFDTITVVDDMTVEITTTETFPTLPAFLNSGNRFGIMGQAQLDDPDTCDSNLIGTGPFSLEDWVPNDHFTATKFADYWQTDSEGVQLPYLDQITFKPTIEADARVNGLLSGQFQMTQGSAATQFEIMSEEAEAGNINLYTTDEFSDVSYGMLNLEKEPFNNVNARRALAHGFDADGYNEVIGLNEFSMASGPFAPGSMGYTEDAGFPEYDLEKAKDFVAKYTEETGKPLTFTITSASGAEVQRGLQYVQAEMAKIGVEAELAFLEQAALISLALSGDWQALGWRNHPGGDPDLQRNWWESGSPLNFGKIVDPELDALMAAGRAELDDEKRQNIYAEVNELFSEEVYNIWFNWTLWWIGMDTSVGGLLGPDLPDGSAPFPGLSSATPVSGLWVG